VSRRLIRERMKFLGLKVKYIKAFRVTTETDSSANSAPNLLDRNFSPEQANQAWCGDISYLKTSSGFLYLAVVIDLYSRRVVGWSVQSHMKAELVDDALRMALARRELEPGSIFHSDRGSQYTSAKFRATCEEAGIVQSMSRNTHKYGYPTVGTTQFLRASFPPLTRSFCRMAGAGHRKCSSLKSLPTSKPTTTAGAFTRPWTIRVRLSSNRRLYRMLFPWKQLNSLGMYAGTWPLQNSLGKVLWQTLPATAATSATHSPTLHQQQTINARRQLNGWCKASQLESYGFRTVRFRNSYDTQLVAQ